MTAREQLYAKLIGRRPRRAFLSEQRLAVVALLLPVCGILFASCGGRSARPEKALDAAGSPEIAGASAGGGQPPVSVAGWGGDVGPGGAAVSCGERQSDGVCPPGCDLSSDADCALGPGESCASDIECRDRNCASGICCAQECGVCQACSQDGAACLPVPYRGTWESSTERCSGDRWCDGLGVCRPKTQLDCGQGRTCMLLETGDVRCWGAGQRGELGYASTDNVGDNELPATRGPIQLGSPALHVAVGDSTTCALLIDGRVQCWGLNQLGQLGRGVPTTARDEFIGDDEHPASFGSTDVGGTVTELVAGYQHACTLVADGSVRCWGTNSSGETGYPTADYPEVVSSIVGNVDVGGSVAGISAGRLNTCALLDTGDVRRWGVHELESFDAPASARDVPVAARAIQVACGASYTCALLADGQVDCRGVAGSAVAQQGPVELGGVATRIAAGNHHACALMQDGGVRCWGDNYWGQLGYGHLEKIGDDESPASAGDVELGGTAAQICAGAYHSCALLTDGRLSCWGWNISGELGYGHTQDIGDDETPLSAGDVRYQ